MYLTLNAANFNVTESQFINDKVCTYCNLRRYMAIAYPMRTLWLNSIGRAKRVIIYIWIAAAIFAAPTAARLVSTNYQVFLL